LDEELQSEGEATRTIAVRAAISTVRCLGRGVVSAREHSWFHAYPVVTHTH